MSGRTSPRVAVLMGGPSAEREVSLSSGRECASALRETGYDVVEIDAGGDLAARLAEARPDLAFNALHGRWGEDGCVQGMLEWLRLPYTHSGVLASALAMDKERTKAVYRAHGLPVVESVLAGRDEIEAGHVMAPPYVVKPANEGSSVGIYIVRESANGPPTLAPDLPARLMVETLCAGARADRDGDGHDAAAGAGGHGYSHRRLVRLSREIRAGRVAACGAGRGPGR